MTGIILAVLVSAWAAYFVYCLKDSNFPSSKRSDGTAAFNRNLGALGQSVVGPNGLKGSGVGSNGSILAGNIRDARLGALLDCPRTPHDASRRRRHVTIGLIMAALVSLAVAALLRVGAAGWAVHVFFDVVLVGFICTSAHWRHRSAEHEMRTLMLHHGHQVAQQSVGQGLSPVGRYPGQGATRRQGAARAAQNAGVRQGVVVDQSAAVRHGGAGHRRSAVADRQGVVVSGADGMPAARHTVLA